MTDKKEPRFIDMTPSWEGLIPFFVSAIESGSAESRKIAIEELTRLARFADQVNVDYKKESVDKSE